MSATHVSSPVMIRSRNSSPSSWYCCTARYFVTCALGIGATENPKLSLLYVLMLWSSLVWPSIIVRPDNTGSEHLLPIFLNGPSQCLQCFSVTLSIHRLISGQEVDEQNAPIVSENRSHHFSRRQSLLEFRLTGRSTMTPMH